MAENKKQHFIPQCYLSNFSNDGKAVWVYNKTKEEPYITSIENIFQEKFFYSIPEELIPEQEKDKIHPLSIESDFFAHQIESQFNHYLKSIVCNINELLEGKSKFQNYNCKLHRDYVDEFAMQIAIQFFRTPKARQEVMNILTDLSIMSQKIDSRYMDSELLSELNQPYNPTIAHFWTIFANDKFIPRITEILKSKIWITYISPSLPFYTSDTPIIVESLNTPYHSDFSLNERGGIITYPLTKKILIKLHDREHYADLVDEDRGIILVNEKFVKQENKKQFALAQNEIVSPINNFYTIK